MAAPDTGLGRYTMFRLGDGWRRIPEHITDPVAYAQEKGAVTVQKGTNLKTATPIWNINTGMLV